MMQRSSFYYHDCIIAIEMLILKTFIILSCWWVVNITITAILNIIFVKMSNLESQRTAGWDSRGRIIEGEETKKILETLKKL